VSIQQSSHLAGRRAETTEGEVVHDVLAALELVLERVELAAELVVTEVELLLAIRSCEGQKEVEASRNPSSELETQ